MAKGDRWSDNQDGEVREMRNAETVSEVGQRPLESRGEIERLKPGSEGVVTRSCGCICFDWSCDQNKTRCATTGTLPRRATGVIWRCEALGRTYPHPTRVAGSPAREPDDCSRQGGRGPGWMAGLTQVNCR